MVLSVLQYHLFHMGYIITPETTLVLTFHAAHKYWLPVTLRGCDCALFVMTTDVSLTQSIQGKCDLQLVLC